MMRLSIALVMMLAVPVAAQQAADDSYRFDNPHPAFPANAGPQVCIDEAHFNFHTVEGRYKPFAELLRADGYRVKALNAAFNANILDTCDILVIANAVAEANSTDWSYPH